MWPALAVLSKRENSLTVYPLQYVEGRLGTGVLICPRLRLRLVLLAILQSQRHIGQRLRLAVSCSGSLRQKHPDPLAGRQQTASLGLYHTRSGREDCGRTLDLGCWRRLEYLPLRRGHCDMMARKATDATNIRYRKTSKICSMPKTDSSC
jgi:hypothetical protein